MGFRKNTGKAMCLLVSTNKLSCPSFLLSSLSSQASPSPSLGRIDKTGAPRLALRANTLAALASRAAFSSNDRKLSQPRRPSPFVSGKTRQQITANNRSTRFDLLWESTASAEISREAATGASGSLQSCRPPKLQMPTIRYGVEPQSLSRDKICCE